MKRFLSFFLVLGSIGAVVGFYWLHMQRRSPGYEEICVTPRAESMTTPWQLYASDGTIHPNVGTDPNGWVQHPLAEGVGMLCGSFPLVPGHTIVLNGAFDVNADGSYGHFGEYWAWMVGANNVSSVMIGGKDVTTKVVNATWSAGNFSGADGHYGVPK